MSDKADIPRSAAVLDDLYERDPFAWSERQVALLRQMAAGEPGNEEIDWSNVIEEVESVGLSELRACESLLLQALVHLLKMRTWPGNVAGRHWHIETGVFLAQAARRFAPSMRQRIDVGALYAEATDLVGKATLNDWAAEPIPTTCPFTLDELVANHPDVSALLGKLGYPWP